LDQSYSSECDSYNQAQLVAGKWELLNQHHTSSLLIHQLSHLQCVYADTAAVIHTMIQRLSVIT